MKKIELLAPAGDLEKFKIAIEYGADAVYFGGEMFGLRAGAGNLSIDEIKEGVAFAHERGKKAYMTANIFAHNEDINAMEAYFNQIKKIPIDAFIVSDPGIFSMIKEIIPHAAIHVSTQANITNYQSAEFWNKMGAERVILARELTFDEIHEIRQKTSPELELEAFVQGAMCISYSGRCLLSNYMIQRDANRGACAHPCRWKYSLVEEQRPGVYYPVEEDDRGTYVFNSKDLCMIEYLPEIIASGISSAKIEGRMKSAFYVATVVRAYRMAIDAYYDNPTNFTFQQEWMDELEKVSHRHFTTGFYYGTPGNEGQNYETSSYIREYDFTGLVLSYDPETGYAVVEQRNKMVRGDVIEVFGPDVPHFEQVLEELYDEDGNPIQEAPHAQQILKIKMDQPVKPIYIIRKCRS